MVDPQRLRIAAERMFAMAMETSDDYLARTLTARASGYLDQAAAIEAAKPPVRDVAQQVGQPQPNEEDDPEE